MQIWIDVEDAAGTRYGDGPITTASEWQSTRRLDGAGSFSFTMPASDPRANLLAHKRIVRCWRSDGNGIYEVGSGIVDAITVAPGSGNSPTLLQVSGDDLLRELANRTVGDLALWEAIEYTPRLSLTTVWPTGSFTVQVVTAPVTIDLSNFNPLRYLYIGYARPFSKITLTLSTANTVLSDTLRVQYYNSERPTNDAWETVGGLVNNTAAPQEPPANPDDADPDLIYPFGVTGANTIEFDPPLGWSPFNGYYYLRFFDEGQDLSPFIIGAAKVTVIEPVADGLQRIMALAPSGWSLDPAGRFATANPVYMQFAGESLLSALVMLAEQTGEHFTLSPASRRLWSDP